MIKTFICRRRYVDTIGMPKISYTEGYDDQSVLKQLWDDRVDIEDLQMGVSDYPVDTELSDSSRFPVENQVITAALAGKQPVGDYATQSEVDAIADDVEALDENKQDRLIAGENITITDNVISAEGESYTAGSGIGITNGVITNTAQPDVNKTYVDNGLAGKLDYSVLFRKIHIGTAETPSASLGEDGDLYIYRPTE